MRHAFTLIELLPRGNAIMAKSFRVHRHLILNYFRACKAFSSGVVEGLNNKAKVGMRRAYGNRSDDVLEVAIFHQLGALPEPSVATDSADEAFSAALRFARLRDGRRGRW
jgi:hypothetical protein